MSPLLLKTGIAGLAKAAAAVIAFVLTAIVARTLGAAESGLFLFGFSLLSALSIFFRLGLDNAILKYVGAEGISELAQKKLNTGLLWIVMTVVPFSCLSALLSDPIAILIFNKPELATVIRWMMLALPFMSLFMLLAMGFQGQHRVILTTIYQNLGLSTLFVVIITALIYADKYNFLPLGLTWLDAHHFSMIYAFCALLVGLSGFAVWYSQAGVSFSLGKLKDTELWAASSNLWVASIMSLAVVWSGVLIAGAFVSSEELAYLTAAQRTATLTSFVLMVVNMVVAPRYAKLWRGGKVAQIQKLAKWSTRAMILMVLPVVLIMVLLPERVMSLFGKGFEQGAVLLAIMAIGQFINVATGSVGYLLNMSGHERDFRRVTLFAGPLTIVLALVLTKLGGALGAAVATAIGLSVQNLLALFMVKKRLGFWPIG